MANPFFKNKLINNQIKDHLEENLHENKENKFGYFIINKRKLDDICIINNHTDWFDLYLSVNHQMIDPVVIKSLSRIEDFEWDEEILISSKIYLPKVMNQAKKYDIYRGHTFILHDYNHCLVLLSIFDNQSYKETNFIINREKLSLLLIKTHQKMLYLYEKFNGNFKISIGITKRETEILYWSSFGKTYSEVSVILGIKPYTVKFHMRNIVKKLNAINAKHAIKLATELKLLTHFSP
ncbi:LuxR C-terminal-related transcriptional regulator [Arsenophonus nasoniae]|uniref:LuxR C-terminal-related transcriptional regulator n=1 Tax=Arsenophonus nasoniae TaxID=638 RepID=UPI0038791E9B